MPEPSSAFYFDFVDPLSYLLDLELRELTESDTVTRIGLEMSPPPTPLATLATPEWENRWRVARERADELDVELATPSIVPWSRKAHELYLLAGERGVEGVVRARVFEAFLVLGEDIGRIDVLVGIGREVGLDATETKAALDVDKYEQALLQSRPRATSDGVSAVPTLVVGGARLEGFHNRCALRTFLRDPSQPEQG